HRPVADSSSHRYESWGIRNVGAANYANDIRGHVSYAGLRLLSGNRWYVIAAEDEVGTMGDAATLSRNGAILVLGCRRKMGLSNDGARHYRASWRPNLRFCS